MTDAESERIRRVYARYDSDPGEQTKRDETNPGLRFIREERTRVLAVALEREHMLPLTGAAILDVGCGTGDELAGLRPLGAVDGNLYGVDLLPDRVCRARARHPEMTFVQGDGRALPYPDTRFDLVMANVVFSSILDDAVASAVAAEMRRVVKTGGKIVIYDNRYPSLNRNVRSYGKRRLRELFPGCDLAFTPLTPLPPLVRLVGRRMPLALPLLGVVPQLKARYLVVVRQEGSGPKRRGFGYVAVEGAQVAVRRDTFLVFGEPMIGEQEIAEVVDTLRSGWIGTGPKTARLEQEFAEKMEARHALAVSSCTAGLHLALDVLGVGLGDEVVTTPMTFVATANVIEHVRATPVFVDVDPETMNIDPEQIEAAITPRTKAIIAVHMAGRPCDMHALRAVAARHDIPLIADAAHAIETQYDGRPATVHADISVFSFYATKNLTTAEGGMITTNSDAWADAIVVRRLHGLSHDAWKRYSVDGFQPYDTLYPGYKYNLTDLQSSLGLHQLRQIEESWRIRERHVEAYRSAFAGMPGVLLPAVDPNPRNRHAHHLFIVLLDLECLTIDRNEFIVELKTENIGAGIHFIPVHLHRYYREKYGYKRGAFPAAEWIGERTVSLPLSAKLTDGDVSDVIAAVARIVERSLVDTR